VNFVVDPLVTFNIYYQNKKEMNVLYSPSPAAAADAAACALFVASQ